ncbi:hypothetical protein BST85_02920 [Aureitalea marina]|uniref:Glycine zipper domain-containing protein n=2 Tax=Aureitalea marina TaxID=930804 RepID=A0A2S7KTS9_9FLAO|nr:hypothetical protein BST85_02920 [Aureitalea marina]
MLILGGFIGQAQNSGSISSSLDIFIFPNDGQGQDQQNDDELACFTWAKQQTGYDPMNPPEYVGEQVDRSADGSAVVGAAGGAAVGAAIGSISGNMGDGAAYGAIIGGLRGRRQKRAAESRQQQSNNTAAANAQKEAENNYKKAFSACMEAKGYTVKF